MANNSIDSVPTVSKGALNDIRPVFAPAQYKAFDEKEQGRIYQLLMDDFEPAVSYPMAKIGKVLIDAGIDRSEYGYKKAKDFFTDMEKYVSLSERVIGGVPQMFITFKAVDINGQAPKVTSKKPTAIQIVQKAGLGHEFDNFANIVSWDVFLAKLAEKALDEQWDFATVVPASPRKSSQRKTRSRSPKTCFILYNYIRYTFYRLQLEDKICIDDEGSFAAFNTGLVNSHFDDIYVCFEPSGQAGPEWSFVDFCTAGSRGIGKQLVRSFNPLPQPPSYVERKEDLLFDLEKDLIVDYQHIIIDGIHRLPIQVLEEEFRGSEEAMQLLVKVKRAKSFLRTRDYYRELGDLLEEDHRLFNRLRSRLEYAISIAKKQVRWDYKMAIPSYYPRRNSMSLLLPLALESESHVDAALVVELLPSGHYQGQTMLTMKQAYLDARLLCRPNSTWLSLPRITSVAADDDSSDEAAE